MSAGAVRCLRRSVGVRCKTELVVFSLLGRVDSRRGVPSQTRAKLLRVFQLALQLSAAALALQKLLLQRRQRLDQRLLVLLHQLVLVVEADGAARKGEKHNLRNARVRGRPDCSSAAPLYNPDAHDRGRGAAAWKRDAFLTFTRCHMGHPLTTRLILGGRSTDGGARSDGGAQGHSRLFRW